MINNKKLTDKELERLQDWKNSMKRLAKFEKTVNIDQVLKIKQERKIK